MLFGFILFIHPRQSKSKNELPATRILRQCNPKQVEIAFLTVPATQFFAGKQVQILQDHYGGSGYQVELVQVDNNKNPLLDKIYLKNMWMFGITKSTSELAAVAHTPLCRYNLGLGINNVEAAVDGMHRGRKSCLLSLCGKLLRQVLTPHHVQPET